MAHPVADVFSIDPPALFGTHCAQCGEYSFPRLDQCPYCGSEGVEPAQLSDHGTLWGWTTVLTPPPGYRGNLPFGFGVVELPEGVRVVTRLTVPDDSWQFGQAMALRIVVLHTDERGDDILTWEFTP